MKKHSITLYAIFVLIFFAGTICYFGLQIYKDYKNGLSDSEAIFKQLSEKAENSPEKITISLLSENKRILSTSLTKNKEILIAYPDEETSMNVSNSGLIKVFNKTIVKDEDVYELKIASYLLKPDSIYSAAKVSFILVLAGTLITIIVLIKVSFSQNDAPTLEERTENLTYEEYEEPESSSYTESIEDQEENSEEDEEEVLSEEAEEAEPETNNEEAIQEETQDAWYDEHKVMESVQEVEKSEREQLVSKINYELTKAASNEQDLALYLLKFENTTAFANIRNYLENTFGRERIFAYEGDTFAVIQEDKSVDEAEDKAAEVEHEMKGLFPEATVFFGISSRSIRMLSAERLLMEAEEALKHTADDPESHIIGFHVDIEKYRELLKNS